MGTTLCPELSRKNPYWIEKHRYYELKHFCLQYPGWRRAYAAIDSLPGGNFNPGKVKQNPWELDPVADCAEARLFYLDRMEMVEETAMKTDPDLVSYIIKGVTEGRSYNNLQTRFGIPCCKDTYYDRYRRFFWLLNKERQ